MKLTVGQTFEQALTLHREAKFKEAEHFYREILKIEPGHLSANYNLAILLENDRKLDEAEKYYKKAIELKPDFTKAHNNLGNILLKLDRLNEAETSCKKAIELKPDFANAYSILGIILLNLDRLNEAEISCKKAIELKPDYLEVHNNLGIILLKLDRLNEAETSCKKAIELKPDFTKAHNNLGHILLNLDRLNEAETSFKKAIELKPDFANAWYNIYAPLQVMKLQTKSIESHLPLLDEQVTSKYAQVAKSILRYRLNIGSPSIAKSLNEVLSALSSTDNTFIKNPKVPSSELIKSSLPKKITAMVHFGRSGTGLMHSLIDGHPEISTLPSIYFSEFFDHFSWEKIITGGWEEMVDRFVSTYEVLFDASSTAPITMIGQQFVTNRGRKEGMTSVGIERNEVLSVDKKVFIKELKQLMDCHDHLDTFTFFKLVHLAYEKTLQNFTEKDHIFYHIHNPDTYAQLNYLRLAPNTNWLMMVREPIQSCESWIRMKFNDNDYSKIVNRIFQMLFEVDQTIYQNQNAIGVRLEDLKKYPKKTISALCEWLGIKEEDSLYQMTAQGKKWWGDPASPDYKKEGMDPFGKNAINRKLGLIFSKNDQFILHTLFYPFSVHFGYAEENLEQFKKDLKTTRPMLDQMFDFEKKIAQNTKVGEEKFMKSGPYLYLRSGMIERWNTLNKFHTYPNMINSLKIN